MCNFWIWWNRLLHCERLHSCGMIVETFTDELHALNSFVSKTHVYEDLKKKISEYRVVVIASPATDNSKISSIITYLKDAKRFNFNKCF